MSLNRLENGYYTHQLPTINNKVIQSGIRFCKAIVPKDENAMINAEYWYNKAYPKIVRSNFKTPPNWEEVRQYQDGDLLTHQRDPWTGKRLVHTCKKPYDQCHNGFWGRWE